MQSGIKRPTGRSRSANAMPCTTDQADLTSIELLAFALALTRDDQENAGDTAEHLATRILAQCGSLESLATSPLGFLRDDLELSAQTIRALRMIGAFQAYSRSPSTQLIEVRDISVSHSFSPAQSTCKYYR